MYKDSYSRAASARMYQIHLLLRARRKQPLNCTTLARKLEVSEKTILRDVACMVDRLDLPVAFVPRLNSYVYTEPVHGFPAVQMTEGEIVALLIGQKALELYRGTQFHGKLAASFRKLTAGLTDKVTFSGGGEVESVSFARGGMARFEVQAMQALTRGVFRELEVTFDYRKPGDARATRRHVQPYAMTYRGNAWYLVGFDLRRGALRTFAIPRIAQANVSQAQFVRPKDFSVQEFFKGALVVLGGTGDYRIVIHFTAAVADRVREREWHESEERRELAGGGLELRLRLTALEEVAAWVLSWGEHARVVEPPELRACLSRTMTALAKEYLAEPLART